jgi:hypothetical protein
MSNRTITDPAIVTALSELGYRASTLPGTDQNSCLHILDNKDDCKEFLTKLGKEGSVSTAEKVLRGALNWPMPNDKEETPVSDKPKQKGGVVAHLRKVCEKGANMDEIMAALAKEFPDRDPDKMKSTVRTQLGGRLVQSGFTVNKTKDEKRGTVYQVAA